MATKGLSQILYLQTRPCSALLAEHSCGGRELVDVSSQYYMYMRVDSISGTCSVPAPLQVPIRTYVTTNISAGQPPE